MKEGSKSLIGGKKKWAERKRKIQLTLKVRGEPRMAGKGRNG